MTIEVQSPGMFTTVQDLGRPGFGTMGVSRSGAADPVALRLGNRLVGNPADAAALEMTLLGGTFRFPEGATVAVTGGACGVKGWSTLAVEPGGVLRVGGLSSGARCYLCVRGGIEVPLFLGSASTHVLSGLGGFEGRALRKGDVLRIGERVERQARESIRADVVARLAPRKVLRVTDGPQAEEFTGEAVAAFYAGSYRVSNDSNRMGIRLQGSAIESPHDGQMPSTGVSLGAIQVPAGGQPIVLFVEQQTTGGYPILANVIRADLASLGQLRPGDEIRFERLDIATALGLLREQESWLNSEDLFR